MVVCLLGIVVSCHKPTTIVPSLSPFGAPVRVNLIGYSGNSMEPFLSRDGGILFFNNLNSLPENTNLHWSTKVNDTTFQYQGELNGVNTVYLEGVPTMDAQGNFYFVSDRNYAQSLSSIYTSTFSNGNISNISLVKGISKDQVGWLNFDVEVDAPGNNLYFVDGRFDQNGGPYEANIALATKTVSGFERASNSSEILKNVNTSDLEYAACISSDGLELYFTRVTAPLNSASIPELLGCIRKNTSDSFGIPSKIESITGFCEAPTISSDGKKLYYHKKENGIFVIFMIQKK